MKTDVTLAGALAALVLLAGCADAPLRESDALLAAGKPEEALQRLEAAARAEPGRADLHNGFITRRNLLVSAYVRDADALRARNQLDAAAAQYRHALRLDPMAEAARAGLSGIEREQRLELGAGEAAAALRNGDAAAAERLAKAVLAEQPSQRGARAVMKALAERSAGSGAAQARLKAALARPVSVELRDAPLKSALDILAREGGLNFIVDKDVRADTRATIAVRDTSIDDVIRLLLLTNQLERRVLNDNTLLIFPATAGKLREYQELVTRTFYLANADAKQTAAMIRTMVKTKDIFTDDKLNLVMIRDTPDAVRLAEKLVAAQDLPEPEVMLEVEVLEVASSLVRDLGVNWPTQIGVSTPLADGSPSSGYTALPIGSVRAFVANPLLLLNLRQTDGVSNLLANPRIRVKNREKAKVHIGERVPVITTTSTANVGVSSSVSYLETGLKLDVEPNVFLEDEVAIKVQLEVSNILEQLNVSGTVSYRLGTRNAGTTLRLKDGETQVLAGLINNEDRRATARVPLVGQVPLFGRLFRSDSDTNVKSEIVLLITPRVVRNIVRPETVETAFASGTEAMPGAPPLRLADAASVQLASVGGAAPVDTTPAPTPLPTPLPTLQLAAPAQVAVGTEFTLGFTLPSDQPMTARVQLQFDSTLITPVGAAAGSSGQAGIDVASGAPGAQLRFKVLATSAASTAIQIRASSSQGPLNVPASHTLAIVEDKPS